MDWPVFKCTGILLTVSAACCGVLLANKKKVFPHLRHWAQQVRGKRTPQYSDTDLSMAAEGIKKYAAEFDGLYEGLYQSAQNSHIFSTDAYKEWCDRVGQMNDEAFQNAFDRVFAKSDVEDEALCREKYSLLLSCIADAGITRDRNSGECCTADDIMHQAYVESGGQKPQVGAVYTVIKAAWLSDGKVIEYGMVMPGSVSI